MKIDINVNIGDTIYTYKLYKRKTQEIVKYIVVSEDDVCFYNTRGIYICHLHDIDSNKPQFDCECDFYFSSEEKRSKFIEEKYSKFIKENYK